MEQIENPEIFPCIYGKLISDKGAKKIKQVENILFNKWCLENWTAMCQKNQTGLLSHTMHKKKFKVV